MDKPHARADIIAEALPIVPFEGWTLSALQQAAEKAGYKRTDIIRLFPGGAIDAVDEFSRIGDDAMRMALKDGGLETMKIRDRIATAVRTRISLNAPHREAVRKAVAMHAMPFYALRGLRALYNTVDAIWYAVGDNSTDFSFYTRRLSLAGVYSATFLYWLDDKSPNGSESWKFLDRRLQDVLAVGKFKNKLFIHGR